MKKLLLFSVLSMSLLSCDFKDKEGNAPLIDDGTGKLVDNPNFKSDAQYEYEEKEAQKKEKFDEAFKDVGSNMKKWADSAVAAEKANPNFAVEKREDFAKSFDCKTGPNELSLSGKKKTIITFTGAFNNELTFEQFENLNYFSELKSLGFEKVILSNGIKTGASKKL